MSASIRLPAGKWTLSTGGEVVLHLDRDAEPSFPQTVDVLLLTARTAGEQERLRLLREAHRLCREAHQAAVEKACVVSDEILRELKSHK